MPSDTRAGGRLNCRRSASATRLTHLEETARFVSPVLYIASQGARIVTASTVSASRKTAEGRPPQRAARFRCITVARIIAQSGPWLLLLLAAAPFETPDGIRSAA